MKKRKKMSAKIKRGGRTTKKIPHTFIVNPASINGGNTMLWEREGKKIHPFHSVSAAQMASNQEVAEKVMERMREEQMKRLEYYIGREEKKNANR